MDRMPLTYVPPFELGTEEARVNQAVVRSVVVVDIRLSQDMKESYHSESSKQGEENPSPKKAEHYAKFGHEREF